MPDNPYQPPGTEKSLARALIAVHRSTSRIAIWFSGHVAATLAFFISKAIQWHASDEMGPGFWTAGNISVIALLVKFGTWIVIAVIMLTNAAVWNYRLTYVAVVWLILTGIYMGWLIMNMVRFVYP